MLIYSIRAFALYKLKDSVAKYIHFLGMAMLPIGNVALYGSIYITLAVSIERFLGKSTLLRTPTHRSVNIPLAYVEGAKTFKPTKRSIFNQFLTTYQKPFLELNFDVASARLRFIQEN